ncbi:MAG TPA: aldose 1-epimerase [Spirochaetota bacterium]|nr:aldose 1-epimerase [Spirochaetota bacterium]HOL56305.1 aldose 1-epimerase [Spirochaetota bacterium]HPP03695.1 aldose 1-epimerase [Spirochaetota bacterium]
MFRENIIKNDNFEIYKEKKNGLTLFSINSVNNNSVKIISNYGSSIKELIFNKNNKRYSILPSFENIREYKIKQAYLNSILFPFPNRINEGKYEFNGIKYTLPKMNKFEPHAIHGLVYNKKFIVYNCSISNECAKLSFIYKYDGKIRGYPFLYDLIVEYNLFIENKIICNFFMISRDKNLPIGFGFHPYFTLNKKIDQLYLKLGDVIRYELDDKNIPTGNYFDFKDFIEYKKIDSLSFDSVFRIKYDGLKISLYDKEDDIKINIYENNGDKLKYFQIYTPPNRNSIAIEPMSCNIDVFNNKDGLKILKENETLNISITIELL